MWGLGIVSIIFSAIIYLQIGLTNTSLSNDVDNAAKRIALAQNMIIYKSAVNNYLSANPTYNGTIPDSSLVFPSWYSKMANWTNNASSGRYSIYLATPLGEVITGELADLSEGSMNAGVKQSGTLWVSGYGNTTVALQPAIPNGSPVYIGSVN